MNNKNKKVVLLNSPKSVGKTELCKYVRDILIETMNPTSMQMISCKDKLYTLVQELFCVSSQRFYELYNNRETKEVPVEEFRVTLLGRDVALLNQHLGYDVWQDNLERDRNIGAGSLNLSVRESLVYVEDVVCKPRWGGSVFDTGAKGAKDA